MQYIREHIDTDKAVVCPLGDIQYDGQPASLAGQMLTRHIDECLERGGLFLGTGDYVDFMSPSNRARLKGAALYDTAQAVVEDAATALVHALYNAYLAPTTDQWLGMVHGHHYFEYGDGTTTDTQLAELLDTPYLGTCAYVELVFGTMGSVLIWVHHGQGNSSKSDAPLTRLESLLPAWEADIFVIGHTSKQAASVANRVYPIIQDGEPTLHHKEIHLVGAGAWSKAFQLGHQQSSRPAGGYVEVAMLNPVALGAPIITVQPETHKGLWKPRIRVEL